MKKMILILGASLMLASCGPFTQNALLETTGGTQTQTGGSGSDAVGNVLDAILGTVLSKTTTVSLPGTWTYNGLSTAVETDNALTTIAASAYKKDLEKKANAYLEKAGLKPGVATFTFTQEGAFSINTGSKQIAAGTYTFSKGEIALKFGQLYNYLNMNGKVVNGASGIQLLFDASSFLNFATGALKTVGGSASSSALGTLIDQITGLQLGMELKK